VRLQQRLADPDAEVRRIAILDLEYSDEGEFLPLLLRALSDRDARVRAEAARVLEGMRKAKQWRHWSACCATRTRPSAGPRPTRSPN
jgi:HEAT repeat protein